MQFCRHLDARHFFQSVRGPLRLLPDSQHLRAYLRAFACFKLSCHPGNRKEAVVFIPVFLVPLDYVESFFCSIFKGFRLLFRVAACNYACNLLCNFPADSYTDVCAISPAFVLCALLNGLVRNSMLLREFRK